MPADAAPTRERILDAAQEVVIGKGFASASVDAIQETAGISRGTFFYHFPSKEDLNRELIVRYAKTDREITDAFMARAEKLARDPLQQVLIFVTLHEELFEDPEETDPGCLFASYSYEAGLFDEETHRLILESVDYFRETMSTKLAEAMERHPPKVTTDPDALADFGYGMLQGAFILSRVREDRDLIIEHLRQFRTYLELLFGVIEREEA